MKYRIVKRTENMEEIYALQYRVLLFPWYDLRTFKFLESAEDWIAARIAEKRPGVVVKEGRL